MQLLYFVLAASISGPSVAHDRSTAFLQPSQPASGLHAGGQHLPRFYHSSRELRHLVAELAAPGPGHCPGLKLTRSLFKQSKTSTRRPIRQLFGRNAWTYSGSESVLDAILISRVAEANHSAGSKPIRYAIFFGEHGRELISVEVGIYVLKALCGRTDVDPAVLRRAQHLLSYAEVLILPNVDESGRESAENGHNCNRANSAGVDLNRNWDYKWAPDYDAHNPIGPEPFSEPESQIAREQLEAFNPHAFLSIHSGDRALWTPGAYDYDNSTAKQQKKAVWQTLLNIAANVKEYTNCKCRVGAPGKVAHVRHPGTSLDFVGLKLNVPFTMAWEIWQTPTEDCLPHFNPTQPEAYHRVLKHWSLAIIYYAESATAAMNGKNIIPVHVSPSSRRLLHTLAHHSDGTMRRLHYSNTSNTRTEPVQVEQLSSPASVASKKALHARSAKRLRDNRAKSLHSAEGHFAKDAAIRSSGATAEGSGARARAQVEISWRHALVTAVVVISLFLMLLVAGNHAFEYNQKS